MGYSPGVLKLFEILMVPAIEDFLLHEPPYSPNLNLIERLWKFVKKEVLNSRHHQDFKRFQNAIDGCLADLPTKHREKLATLMTHKFQTWDDVSLLNA